MKENQLMTLPSELAQIADNVTIEKRTEVQTVLNSVFSGVAKMRDQLNGVEVSGVADKLNMKLANTIRLSVRQVRLEAEKTFDAKRAEVQQQMLSYKTEDALWLKAKQTMQILTKEIEENARWKEETRERYEAEQRELKIQQRQVKLSAITSELERSEYENMSDESFDLFYSGLEKSHNEKIEAARIEEENRIAKIKADEEERIRLNAENERLKKEAQEKERLAEIERKKQEAERQKQEKLLQAEREKAAKEKQIADAKIEKERQEKIAAENQLKKEREEKARKEKEDQERLEAEKREKVEQARLEQLRIEEENEKRLSASDSEKINQLIKDIEALNIPAVSGRENKNLIKEIKNDLSKITGKLYDAT